MKKPVGIISYTAPWLIPLLLFLAGFFLSSVIEIRVEIGSDRQVSTNR